MKKYLLIPLLVLFMASCSSNAPKDVTKNFLEALAKGKIDDAKKYASAPTAKFLEKIATIPGASEQMKQPDFKFTFVKESIEGDKATVTYKDQKGEEEDVELIKEDGKWKVTH